MLFISQPQRYSLIITIITEFERPTPTTRHLTNVAQEEPGKRVPDGSKQDPNTVTRSRLSTETSGGL